jgi:hypothetical protein
MFYLLNSLLKQRNKAYTTTLANIKMNNMKLKILLLLFLSFFTHTLLSQEIVRIKDSGFGDESIRIKESGFGDISVRFKDSGFGDFSVGFTNSKSKADYVLKYSGFGDRSVRIKESGFGDISIRIKESGFGDVTIRIKESGTVDYLIYSENDYVPKREIVAALINVIKKEAEYED